MFPARPKKLGSYPAWVYLLPLIFISPLFVMACCPPGSWGELKKDADYKDLGTVDKVGDLSIYRVGTADKCIVWNYDIFGFNGGRTRQLCDQLADKGYTVLLPNYYRDQTFDLKDLDTPKLGEFIKNVSQWSEFKALWNNTIKPYAEQHGCKVYGTIGTCWGTYPTVRFSSLPDFKAGVSMHPSHTRVMQALEEDETKAMEELKDKPQLFMPAQDDDVNVKPGGLAEKILGKSLKIVEFNDMKHGWTSRGDISDPKVKAEVIRAMVEATKFFDEHIK